METWRAINASFSMLSRQEKVRWLVFTVSQCLLSILDLVGVLALGAIAALSVSLVQAAPIPQTGVAKGLSLIPIQDLSPPVIVLGAMSAAFLLLLKSVISAVVIRRMLLFLARVQGRVARDLSNGIMSRNTQVVTGQSTQELSYALMNGASYAVSGLLGQTSIFIGEASLLVLLGAALALIDPWVTAASIIYFLFIAVVLQRVIGRWASAVGESSASTDIESLNLIQDSLAAFREISVANKRRWYGDQIGALRLRYAHVMADSAFLSLLPKYVFEGSLVLGAGALALVLFLTRDVAGAVGTLAAFLVAGSRVMPSLLRLQGCSIAIRISRAAAIPTYQLSTELGTHDWPSTDAGGEGKAVTHIGTSHTEAQTDDSIQVLRAAPDVELRNVSFAYPGADRDAVHEVTATVAPGSHLAVVGRSGAGKTTLVDLILGILEPTAGEVTIQGLSPLTAIANHPGRIAYVPQDVAIFNRPIWANVVLGSGRDEVDDERLLSVLDSVGLTDLVSRSDSGLEAMLGERGMTLSGGQRQRIGLARALYGDPALIVLDEATSALDAETEQTISGAIQAHSGQLTTISIAHRLSTIRFADLILYLEDGRTVASGTFDELRSLVPSFERQAQLMGLR